MRSLRIAVFPLGTALVVLLATPLCPAQDTGGAAEEVLAKLRAFDAVYRAAFRCEGTQTTSASPMLGGKSHTTTFRYSRANDVQAVEDVFDVKLDESSGDGNTVLERTKSVVLYDNDVAGQFNAMSEFDPGAEKLEPLSESNSMDLHKPDSEEYFYFTKSILWCAGRDYAGHINSVSSVEQLDDGRLKIVAFGGLDENDEGRWELVVEPAASYLVRQAVYYTLDDDPRFSISNQGLRQDGDCSYPETAVFRFEFGEASTEYQMVFTTAALSSDAELISSARAYMDGKKFPPNTIVHDNRTEPAITFAVDHKGEIVPNSSEPEGPQIRSAWGRRRLVLLGLNIVFLAAVAIWVVRRRKKQTPA